MKTLIKNIIILSAFILLLPGCYTVLLTPDSNSSEYVADDGYYTEDYFGGYSYYYDYPWWLYTAPTRSTVPSSDRDSEISTIRNTDGGRSATVNRPIINTPPPTRNGDSNTGSSDSNTGKSNSGSSGTSVDRSSSNNNTRSSGSNNNGSARNNNGSRGSNNGRR